MNEAMKDYRLRILAVICCIVGFLFILGIAGGYDYTDQVILSMSYEEYDMVKDTLMKQNNGEEPSEREIAHWWTEHHNEYRK